MKMLIFLVLFPIFIKLNISKNNFSNNATCWQIRKSKLFSTEPFLKIIISGSLFGKFSRSKSADLA